MTGRRDSSMENSMRLRLDKRTLAFIFIFLIGLSILLYPLVSSTWNQILANRLMGNYDDTVEYLYEGLDFSIAEVKYNEISIISNPDSGKVFDIIYWNLNVTPEQEQYDYELYYHKFSSYYGKLETYFFSDSSSVKLESNTEIIFGGSHETYDSYFNFVIQNEDYNS